MAAASVFVVDASMAVSWVHPAQSTRESEAWLDKVANGATLLAPSVWPLEVANALLALQRRKRITPGERADALRSIGALPAEIDHHGVAVAFHSVSDLAASESLSVYDATYLELAIRLECPIACGDASLRAAALRNGVGVTAASLR